MKDKKTKLKDEKRKKCHIPTHRICYLSRDYCNGCSFFKIITTKINNNET